MGPNQHLERTVSHSLVLPSLTAPIAAAQLEENSVQTGLSPSWSHTQTVRRAKMRLGLAQRRRVQHKSAILIQPSMEAVSPFVGYFVSQDMKTIFLPVLARAAFRPSSSASTCAGIAIKNTLYHF